MNPQVAVSALARVLVVDDDSMSRRSLRAFLEKAGYTVVTASGVEDAIQTLRQISIQSIDCVVTDYRMPDKDGLWLLRWIQEQDPHMSAIMVTAEGEKQLVTASLRQGACDFLDKPVEPRALSAAVAKASQSTRQHRSMARAESDVKAIGRIQAQMVGHAIPDAGVSVELCYHPSHEAGGDYISIFPLNDGTFLVLATDVSGHDLRAAYLSAYFQGFVRGMIENQTPIDEVLSRFNRFLLEESSRSRRGGAAEEQVTSVAVSALVVDRRLGTATSISCGFPVPLYVEPSGHARMLGEIWSSPLGWFDDAVATPAEVATQPGGWFYLWTDGLEDIAVHLNVSPLACAFALVQARKEGRTPPWMQEANDDILLARIQVSELPSPTDQLIPILLEQLPGSQHDKIDELQASWSRSLRIALPDLPEEKLFDVILCAREVMLNALKHGCRCSPHVVASLALLSHPEQQILRLIVEDPGPGHDFDLKAHRTKTEESLIEEHRGLMLLETLSIRMETRRRGACVELDFNYSSPSSAQRAVA